jgi:hypothetical protein
LGAIKETSAFERSAVLGVSLRILVDRTLQSDDAMAAASGLDLIGEPGELGNGVTATGAGLPDEREATDFRHRAADASRRDLTAFERRAVNRRAPLRARLRTCPTGK